MEKKKDTGKKKPTTKKAAPKKETKLIELPLPQNKTEKSKLTWVKRNLLKLIEGMTDREAQLFTERNIKYAAVYMAEFRQYPPKIIIDGVEFYPSDFEDLAITTNTYLNPSELTDQDSPTNYKQPDFNFS